MFIGLGCRFAITLSAILVVPCFAQPAVAATPEGTIAALLLQVNPGFNDENPGSVIGDGFNCNLSAANHAFDGDFPEAGPCLRFYSEEQSITLVAVPRANYVFQGWTRQCGSFGSNPVITLSTAQIPFSGDGTVPDCIALFTTSACFVPPDNGGGDLVAGETATQVEECPADDPNETDCPEGAIVGDDTDETIDGTEGDDVICGLGGNDTINGFGGDDLIFGGGGDDRIESGDGADVAMGDSGDDTIHGDDGDDVLLGGSGSDLINGDMGEDVVTGGAQRDLLIGGGGHDRVFGGDGRDELFGGPGDDQLDGQAGPDTIFGCGGSDKLTGGGANDSLFGDIADLDLLCEGDAGAQGAGNASPARDVIQGGPGDDLILGNGGNDTLRGAGGADDMNGGDGNDVLFGMLDGDLLEGGSGNDILRGGEGADAFVAGDGQTDALHGGDGCDAANGRYDDNSDALFSIEHPDDFCPLGP